jgi:hypothetical protein
MSIQVAWVDRQRAILGFTFRGTWSWNDLYDALSAGFVLADTVHHPVALLFDLRATTYLPEDLMSQLKHICALRHYNETVRVLITDLPFWRSLYAVCTRLFPSASSRYYMVPTPQDAYELIAERSQEAHVL